MCIRLRPMSFLYKLIVLLITGWGLYLYSGLPEGALNLNAFKYYTILSNLLVFLFYLYAVVYVGAIWAKKGPRGTATPGRHFKGAVVMAITVTMLIYWILLSGSAFSMGDGSASEAKNYIVHLIVPLLVLIDWLLFDRKGRYTIGDPFYWEIIPLAYWAYTILAAQLGVTYLDGARYPYFFINADELGWGIVIRNVALLCLAFLVLGYIFFGIDKLLGRFAKKRTVVVNEGASTSEANGDIIEAPRRAGRDKNVFRAGDKVEIADTQAVENTAPPAEQTAVIEEALRQEPTVTTPPPEKLEPVSSKVEPVIVREDTELK